MVSKQKKIIIILVLLLCQVGLFYTWLKWENIDFLKPKQKIDQPLKVEERILETHKSYFISADFYNQAYEAGTKQIISAEDKVYGGIIPHHLMPKDKIAAWFLGLKDTNYDTVVLIGPNHFEAGEADIIISQAKWETPYGELLPDLKLSDNLLKVKNIKLDEKPFGSEHSISGLVPFIKKSLPQANIVPIILKNKTKTADLDNLAANLASLIVKEKTLVLASVDFSHWQTDLVSDFHDDLSQNVIETFDFERIHNLEIDSPASIYAVLKYLEKIDAQKSQLAFHTDSSELLKKPDEAGTSHFYYYFSTGQKKTETALSLLFFGDLMLDRNVKTIIDKNGLGYIFNNLATEENRFFMSPDIISANLEGALTNSGTHYPPEASIDFAINPDLIKKIKKDYFFNFFNLANNHITDQGQKGLEETKYNLNKLNIDYSGCPDAMLDNCSSQILDIADQKIAMFGFSMVYNNFDLTKAINEIKEAKEKNNLVIAQIHWGAEYTHNFNEQQQNIAHQFIDAGADIIIGHHPHVVQGIEIYNNKPIFYSLGNFVFDQYFSPDTQEELAVGISYQTGEYKIYLFPIQSNNSQLSLMTGENKNNFFKKIADWSNITQNFEKQLLSGQVLIK
ncbi:MAG: AmmeMemoRadiSam system protein B [Patescibacteria group bacterium]